MKRTPSCCTAPASGSPALSFPRPSSNRPPRRALGCAAQTQRQGPRDRRQRRFPATRWPCARQTLRVAVPGGVHAASVRPQHPYWHRNRQSPTPRCHRSMSTRHHPLCRCMLHVARCSEPCTLDASSTPSSPSLGSSTPPGAPTHGTPSCPPSTP